MQGSWMVVDDFNAISDVSEKFSGRTPKIQDLKTFNAMINDRGICEPTPTPQVFFYRC